MNASARPGLALLALAFAIVVAPAAAGDDRSDGDLRALRQDEALLVLPIHAKGDFASLEFHDPVRKVSFTIDDIEDRLQLVVVRVPAGSYHLRKATLPRDRFVEYEANDKWIPRFTVRAGGIVYAGDMRVAMDGRRVVTSFGANTMDALPVLLRRERELAPDLFERFPFALITPLDGAVLAGRAPDPAWTLPAWRAAVPSLQPDAQGALATRVFERLGGAPIAVGTAFAGAMTALEKLDKRRAQIDALPKEHRILVRLDGLWGDRGHPLAIELIFVSGVLAQFAARVREDSDLWGIPPADARQDLEAFAAGR